MKKFFTLLAALCFTAALSLTARAATTCTFTTSGTTMTLNGSCTTDSSIIVPNGFTLDGAGYTITAVDPPAGHFVGGVLQNGGATANVTNVRITASGLADICDAGASRLRGVLFDSASGSISNVQVINLNQGASGCQEGNAIEVRNFGPSPATSRVRIDSNTAKNYQKTGIIANGNVDATITDNTVDGGGPVGYIARNGIQVGFGATGMVKRNTVMGNSYTGPGAIACGVLVFSDQSAGDPLSVGTQVMQNTISENDVGVLAEQYGLDGFSAPAAQTNVKITNNVISKAGVTNGYVYQAGVADIGNNDKIISNRISGAGYDPATLPGSTFAVDADPSFTNRPKVHANK
ncbi:MAG TPA: right-handed parallel beta-helix repeat-containing protein [Pyrinomonadaceae bacterium]|nr:right-handed parallel beta-helix repeat-containing protein [Pyrinomonadaceae bacterium]